MKALPSWSRFQRLAFSTLEFTLALAVMVPLLFGAIDLNNILRAYTALQEGTNTGLRCIYPVDGQCSAELAAPATRLFNWFKTNHSDTFFVRQSQFRGTGYWLESPRYIYDTYQAHALTGVSYDLPRWSYVATNGASTLQQRATVLAETQGLPWITGSSGRNPSFRYNREHSTNRSSDLVLTWPNNQGILLNGNNTSDQITFNLPVPQNLQAFLNAQAPGNSVAQRNLLRSLSVYELSDNRADIPSPNLSGSQSSVLASRKATSPFSSAIKALVWIEATVHGGQGGTVNDNSRTSKVRLWINNDDEGGQIFGQPGASSADANFYPRGAGAYNPLRVDLAGLGAAEEWSHTVDLHFGSNSIRIAKDLSSGYGWPSDLTFHVDAVHVFIPRYQLYTISGTCPIQSCDGTVTNQFCPSVFSNQVTTQATGSFHYPLAFASQHAAPASTGGNNAQATAIGVFFTEEEARAAAPTTLNNSCAAFSATPALPMHVSSESCMTEMSPGSDEENMAACPPRHPILSNPAYAGEAQNVQWTSAWKTVPENAAQRAQGNWDFVFERSNCNSSFSFTPPTSLSQYREYRTPAENEFNPARTTYSKLNLNGADPRVVRQQDNRYGCSAMTLRSMRFDGHSTPTIPVGLPTSSIFSGERSELVNSPQCRGERLKNDALEHGLPIEAFFEGNAAVTRELEVTNPPTDSCVPYRRETKEQRATLIASSVNEATTPSDCRNGGCYRTFAGYIPGSANRGEIDQTLARSRAQREIQAAYPRAQAGDCADDSYECPRVTISDQASANKHLISVEAAMAVPMNLLGGHAVQLKSKATRELELNYLR